MLRSIIKLFPNLNFYSGLRRLTKLNIIIYPCSYEWKQEIVQGSSINGDEVQQLPKSHIVGGLIPGTIGSDSSGNPVPFCGQLITKTCYQYAEA